MQFIGQSQGLIHDVCSAEEMMQRLVKDLDKRLLAIQEKKYRDGYRFDYKKA